MLRYCSRRYYRFAFFVYNAREEIMMLQLGEYKRAITQFLTNVRSCTSKSRSFKCAAINLRIVFKSSLVGTDERRRLVVYFFFNCRRRPYAVVRRQDRLFDSAFHEVRRTASYRQSRLCPKTERRAHCPLLFYNWLFILHFRENKAKGKEIPTMVDHFYPIRARSLLHY